MYLCRRMSVNLSFVLLLFGPVIVTIAQNAEEQDSRFLFHPNNAAVKSSHVLTSAGTNLLRNSSFEVDALDGWWPSSVMANRRRDDRAPDGNWYVTRKFTLPQDEIRSEFRNVDPERTYTFSVYLRANRNNVPVTIALRSGLKQIQSGLDYPGPARTVRVDSTWRRYQVTGTLTKTIKNAYFVSISSEDSALPVTLSLDALQLEVGEEPTDYRPDAPVAVGARIVGETDFVYAGEHNTPVQIDLYKATAAGEDAKIHFELRDLFSNTVRHWDRVVTLDGDGACRLTEPVNAGFFGVVRLNISAEIKGVESNNYQLCWAVWPAKRESVDTKASYFGIHAPITQSNLSFVDKLGSRWIRLLGWGFVTWAKIEPEVNDGYEFDDTQADLLRRSGLGVIGVLFATPRWAAATGTDTPGMGMYATQAYPPRDENDFADYVQMVSERYADVVSVWEVWNEPYGRGFWRGTPEQYVDLLKIAHDVIRQTDPKATILSGNVYHTHGEWMDAIFKADALRYVDVVPYHHYGESLIRSNHEGRRAIESIRGIVDGYGGHSVPLWNSEYGLNAPDVNTQLVDGLEGDHVIMPTPDSVAAAAALVRKSVYSLSLGIDKLMYYCVLTRDYFSMYNIMSLRGIHGVPKSTASAYAILAHEIDGLDFVDRVVVDDIAETYVFRGDGRGVAIVWGNGLRYDETHVYVDLTYSDGKIEFFDIMGNPLNVESVAEATSRIPLSASPVYIHFDENDADNFVTAVQGSGVVDMLSHEERALWDTDENHDRMSRMEGYQYVDSTALGNAAIVALYMRREQHGHTEARLLIQPRAVNTRVGLPQIRFRLPENTQLPAGIEVQDHVVAIPVHERMQTFDMIVSETGEQSLIDSVRDATLADWVPFIPSDQCQEVRQGHTTTSCYAGTGYHEVVGLMADEHVTLTIPPGVDGWYRPQFVVRTGGLQSEDYSAGYYMSVNGKPVPARFVGPAQLIFESGKGWNVYMGIFAAEQAEHLREGDTISVRASIDWAMVGECLLRPSDAPMPSSK